MKLPTPDEQAMRIIQKWPGHISAEALPGLHRDIADALKQRDDARVRPVTVLALQLGALAFMSLQFGFLVPLIFGVLATLIAVYNLSTAD